MTQEQLLRAFRAWEKGVAAATRNHGGLLFSTDAQRYADEAVAAVLAAGLASEIGEIECGTLVAVVGSSPQPVLLSIAALKPTIVVLAGPPGGAGFRKTLRGVLDKQKVALAVDLEFDPSANIEETLKDFLHHLKNLPKPWVLDITGGRKTMAAIAFLLGLEEAITTVYVRGDYNPTVGVPEPCTERLVKFVDPRRALLRRARKQARQFWEKGAFDRVVEVLQGLDFDEEDEEALEQARRLRAWQQSDFSDPAFATIADEHCRRVATFWGGLQKGPKRSEALVSETGLLFGVLADELRWLRQCSGLKPRERYLRAFANGESAMEGVVHHQVGCGNAIEKPLPDGKKWDGRTRTWLLCRENWDHRLQGWTPLDKDKGPIRIWMSDTHRAVRNKCAHAYAHVDEGDLEEILVCAEELLGILARRIEVEGIQERLESPLPLELPEALQ